MAEKIYIRNASGGLEPLEEKPFGTEELLQQLIGQHPELLAGDQMQPGDPLRWILIKREMPIEGWAVDHLLLDQHARPTLVEVKRASNREIRREIVGQMLDYAATASGVWSERDMRRIFEESSSDPDGEISSLLQEDEEPDIDSFWERVATNLSANRLRLLFVADEIPVQLERVVKFLNEQTRDNLEVLAVEIKQYPGKFGDALVSRVIGQVKARQNDRLRVAREDKIREDLIGRCTPAGRDALLSLLEAAQAAGAYTHWGNNGLAISKRSPLTGRWPNVACFNWWADDDGAPLALVSPLSEIHSPELRVVLQRWIDKFNGEDFVEPFTKLPRYEGWAVAERDFVKHVDLIKGRLLETLDEIAHL